PKARTSISRKEPCFVFPLTVQFPWVTDSDVAEAGVRADPGSALDIDMGATPTELLTERLHNHQLIDGNRRHNPADVVSWMVAMQAQDYLAAKWAIGLRAPGCHDGDVEHAFNEGRILRTHVLRPTWHFVAPEDIRWMLALTGPRILGGMVARHRQLELDAATLARARKALERALAGGDALTRAQLGAALQRARVDPGG